MSVPVPFVFALPLGFSFESAADDKFTIGVSRSVVARVICGCTLIRHPPVFTAHVRLEWLLAIQAFFVVQLEFGTVLFSYTLKGVAIFNEVTVLVIWAQV